MSGCKYTVKYLYEHSLQVLSYPGDKIYSVWLRFTATQAGTPPCACVCTQFRPLQPRDFALPLFLNLSARMTRVSRRHARNVTVSPRFPRPFSFSELFVPWAWYSVTTKVRLRGEIAEAAARIVFERDIPR